MIYTKRIFGKVSYLGVSEVSLGVPNVKPLTSMAEVMSSRLVTAGGLMGLSDPRGFIPESARSKSKSIQKHAIEYFEYNGYPVSTLKLGEKLY